MKQRSTTDSVILGILLFFLVSLGLGSGSIQAQEYTSSSFMVRDAVIGGSGGRSTGNVYELFQEQNQSGIGESTNSTLRNLAGFLYFPFATNPVLTASASNGQVDLSWTASTGTLANITDYQVGIATASGGPYTYTSVGNVTSSSRTGLTNGTTYYFRVHAMAGTLYLAESNTASATPSASTGSVRLTGYASPNNTVTYLRNGVVMGTSTANGSSFFDRTFSGIAAGTYSFGVYGSDAVGRTTLTVTVDSTVISGSTITVGELLLPPTISVTKNTLKRPDKQLTEGYARNNATVQANFNSETITKEIATDNNGKWTATVTEVFSLGSHSSNALVKDTGGNQSVLSSTQPFTVVLSADLNVDNLVNLTDFSILMFNYGRSNPPNKAADINDNTIIDLQDFSIMMFHWTGG